MKNLLVISGLALSLTLSACGGGGSSSSSGPTATSLPAGQYTFIVTNSTGALCNNIESQIVSNGQGSLCTVTSPSSCITANLSVNPCVNMSAGDSTVSANLTWANCSYTAATGTFTAQQTLTATTSGQTSSCTATITATLNS